MYFAGKTPQSCPVPQTPDTRDALERITPAAQPCSRGVSSRRPLSPIFTFAIPFPATPATSPGSPTCSVQVPPAQPKFGQSFPSRVKDPGPPHAELGLTPIALHNTSASAKIPIATAGCREGLRALLCSYSR